MAGKYQTYPEHKDSGVGQIPSEWNLSKHKYIALFKKGRNSANLSEIPKEKFVKYLSMDYLVPDRKLQSC